MRVEVTLKGSLAGQAEEALPGASGTVQIEEGATLAQLREDLGISVPHCICVLNGSAVAPDTVLGEGDRVQLFPAAAGGSLSP